MTQDEAGGYRAQPFRASHTNQLGAPVLQNTSKPEWVQQDQFGMPQPGGDLVDVKGKHVEIWLGSKEKVTEDQREAIRGFCGGLVTAINKFYAFGSVFSEEI